MTYDIFEELELCNEACSPLAEPDDARPVWIDDQGRRIRLLGTLRRQHLTRIQPAHYPRAAANVVGQPATAYSRHTAPRRPWTEEELNRRNGYIPDERLYSHTELAVGELPDGSGFFSLEPWTGR
jgi:hypothetical protein